MRPVDLKIKYEHLIILNEVFAKKPIEANVRSGKALQSIMDTLSRKLLKKQMSKENKEHKPFKISLAYHEAAALYKVVEFGLKNEIDTYVINALHMLYNDLDQKLGQ